MKPRAVLILPLALGLLAAPLAAEAQHSGQPARVGILVFGPAPSPEEQAKFYSTAWFWQAMKDLGWAPGQNVVAERRYGESPDQLRAWDWPLRMNGQRCGGQAADAPGDRGDQEGAGRVATNWMGDDNIYVYRAGDPFPSRSLQIPWR